jgi:hypothetical protein
MKRSLARTCTHVALALLVLLGSSSRAADPAASPTVREAWSRATPPGSTVAAVYLTIVGGAQPDRLLDARTARAGTTQLHAVTHDGGMTRMRAASGVDVPARGKVVLAPDALHLMLMDLARPLTAGESFTLKLRFAHAGTLDVTVEVVPPGASGPWTH